MADRKDRVAAEASMIAKYASDAACAIAMNANGSRTDEDTVSDVARATARAAGVVAEIAYDASHKAHSHLLRSRAGDLGANYVLGSAATDAAAAGVATRKVADAAHRSVADIESRGVQRIPASDAIVPDSSSDPELAADMVEFAVTEAAIEAVGEVPCRRFLSAIAANAASTAAGAVAKTAAAAVAGAAAARQIGDTQYRPIDGHDGDAKAAAKAVAKAVYSDPVTRGPPADMSAFLRHMIEGTTDRTPVVANAIDEMASAQWLVGAAVSAARAVGARADSDLAAALQF